MVGEEFESGGLDVGLEFVKLDAVLVIDVGVFLLGDGEVGLVM